MKDKNFFTQKTIPSELQETSPSEPQENIELPPELWLHIFSFLDPKSLLSGVQLTSKLFYQLANDPWVSWKNLFQRFFPHELPEPLPPRFDWQTAFKTLFLGHYGTLSPQQQKSIFLIATGAIEEIRAAKISLQDLQADQFILIKTAAQFKQQAILDLFYAKVVDQILSYKDYLYWATLCNQPNVVDHLIKEQPSLINKVIFEEDITITLLAGLVGHLDLMKKLMIQPNNDLLAQGFSDLYHCIVRNGQLYMFNGFHSFIKEHEADTSSRLSARVKTAATGLPSTFSLGARYGSLAVVKAALNPLHQKCLQLREIESLPNSSTANTGQGETEPPQLAIEAEDKTKPTPSESYEEAKSTFDLTIRTMMIKASEHGQVNIVKYVLENHFFEIDQSLIRQQTLLYRAAEHNHLELVKFLLKNQADPESTLTMLLNKPFDSKNKAYCEILSLLVDAIEERKKLSSPKLIKAVIRSNRVDILERLFAINPKMITKTLHSLLSQQSNITDLRNLFDIHDQLLKLGPIDKNRVLSLIKEKKQKLLAKELHIEIELEKKANLRASSLSSEELTLAQLKIQIRATGIRRGIEYAAHHRTNNSEKSAHPLIRFPCSLFENLNAFKRLTASNPKKVLALKCQLREIYFQSYEEGLAKGNAKPAEVKSSKRKWEYPEKKHPSKKGHIETSQNREEKQEQNEKETEKQLSVKRKRSEQENKGTHETKRRLESPAGRFGLFANSNRDTGLNVEEQRPQTPSTVTRNDPAQYFAAQQSSSPDSETKYTDLSP
ncbi:Ankyrin repeats (3 copies) [Legionella nautarum]|uniref:Ankyrin repeats (3 copies) n=1 Tax=Legionella nautarum TaxID=45070 RepID=A0A0W0WKI5_9GAMM|nr:F-box-like domain-containing protein [Legionella nautarum]KTD32844.1 Ankyrin repeats (3 copies) [Legionella nautarum]